MAKIGKLPQRRREDQSQTTPVDLLTVHIGGLATQARPYEVAINPQTGEQYPSRAATSCPHCGHGIYFDIRQDQLLMNEKLTAACTNCCAGEEKTAQPLGDLFRNPFAVGLISKSELVQYEQADLKSESVMTAAEKIKKKQMTSSANELLSLGEEPEEA